MLIQCKDEIFNKISTIMDKREPFIVKEPGKGYVNVFDKDWIFISLNENKYPEQTKRIYDMLLKSDEPFIVAFVKSCRLILQKICETEQYVFCRRLSEGHKITNAWTTYISY